MLKIEHPARPTDAALLQGHHRAATTKRPELGDDYRDLFAFHDDEFEFDESYGIGDPDGDVQDDIDDAEVAGEDGPEADEGGGDVGVSNDAGDDSGETKDCVTESGDAASSSNELMAPTSEKSGADGDEGAAAAQPESASPAPMTSSSSFTGDSSLPTIQRPTCLPTHSSTKKDLSCWTSDGEMDFTQKAITVFVHCQLLTIFGHGVEKPQSQEK